jgi:hypothetical protein
MRFADEQAMLRGRLVGLAAGARRRMGGSYWAQAI